MSSLAYILKLMDTSRCICNVMKTVMSKVNENNEMREEVARDYASLLIGKRMRSLSSHYFIIFIKDSCSSE